MSGYVNMFINAKFVLKFNLDILERQIENKKKNAIRKDNYV
jgi:hypothetical protein